LRKIPLAAAVIVSALLVSAAIVLHAYMTRYDVTQQGVWITRLIGTQALWMYANF